MFALDKLTPVQLDQFIYQMGLVERQEAAAEKVRALRAYYAGDHPVLLTDRQKEFLGGLVGAYTFGFAHNLIRVVIDTQAERLSVTGFTVNDAALDATEDDANAQAARVLWARWKAWRADLLEHDLYVNAKRDGTAYALVDFDPLRNAARLIVHEADDGKSGIVLHHNPENPGEVLYATRYWWTFDPLRPGQTGIERKTVYLPGEVRKYARVGAGAWRPVQDDGDLSWPLAWVGADGQPLGVPVIEFTNPGGPEAEPFAGLQNALNKAWLDLIAAADAAGFPLMVVEYTGDAPLGAMGSDDDSEGADELRMSPGRVLEIAGGTLKRLEAANLAPMLEVIWALTATIAGVSRTPQYYLRPVGGADVPSGESLKQLEAGLVAKVVKCQRVWGQAWEDVLALASRIEATFGGGALLPDDATLAIQWADPNTRNELSQAQMAQIHKNLGVPDEQVWQQLGYSPEQIAEFTSSANANKAAQVAGMAAALRTVQSTNSNGQVAAQGSNGNGRANNAVQPVG